VHVAELGLKSASDSEILERALTEDRIVLSADTDFGTALASSRANKPSVVIIRRSADRRVGDLVALLKSNLADLADALEDGSVVVFDGDRIRVRRLPLA
jgi:predicted nuclease of predicted toxin-antitoxin system